MIAKLYRGYPFHMPGTQLHWMRWNTANEIKQQKKNMFYVGLFIVSSVRVFTLYNHYITSQ